MREGRRTRSINACNWWHWWSKVGLLNSLILNNVQNNFYLYVELIGRVWCPIFLKRSAKNCTTRPPDRPPTMSTECKPLTAMQRLVFYCLCCVPSPMLSSIYWVQSRLLRACAKYFHVVIRSCLHGLCILTCCSLMMFMQTTHSLAHESRLILTERLVVTWRLLH